MDLSWSIASIICSQIIVCSFLFMLYHLVNGISPCTDIVCVSIVSPWKSAPGVNFGGSYFGFIFYSVPFSIREVPI